MDAPDHSLPSFHPAALKDAKPWLLLGVIALGVAGIFAGLLGGTQSHYFYKALVVHVDLSVLVWFLTMACMFFTLAANGRGWPVLAWGAFYSFALGALLIALSSLVPGDAYMSNYIPVIHHPVFFMGLALILCGTLGAAINLLAACSARDGIQSFGIVSAVFILCISLLCFFWSQQTVSAELHGQIYYEYIFWGGGHMLQFVHTQLMLVAWLWLADAAGLKLPLPGKAIVALYVWGLLSACAAPFIYMAHDAMSDVHRNAFTMLMKHANGLAPLVLGGFIIVACFSSLRGAGAAGLYSCHPRAGGGLSQDSRLRGNDNSINLPKITLIMSMLLFAAGGTLGYMIAGSNVTVPAHYHGSIVGVTLAFMGVAYLLLPKFGYKDVSQDRLALWQPLIYGGGQLCWMTGMAILGAHGVPRKTPGSADTVGALASFLKHGGDGLALIGGLLFVFVVLRAVWKRDDPIIR